MLKLFKNLTNKEYQKIFLNTSIEVFKAFLYQKDFKQVRSKYDDNESILVFQNKDKFIKINSFHEPRDQYFFEIYLGENFDFEIDDFNGYLISINRLKSIINNSKVSFYYFPFGKKQSLKSLFKAKEDLIKYASFYLDEDIDLFNRVLKIKGIK